MDFSALVAETYAISLDLLSFFNVSYLCKLLINRQTDSHMQQSPEYQVLAAAQSCVSISGSARACCLLGPDRDLAPPAAKL